MFYTNPQTIAVFSKTEGKLSSNILAQFLYILFRDMISQTHLNGTPLGSAVHIWQNGVQIRPRDTYNLPG
jgi:hypothetical protein